MDKLSVILLCGGKGTRMKSDIPKQFLSLNKKPVACYSFDVFKSMPEVAEIVIVSDTLYRHHFPLDIPFALPGERRQDSVFNGLKALQKNSRMICVHDSARPFIDQALVRRVIQAAEEHGAATAAMPVKFTLKEHDGNCLVKNTPDRSKYWEIQTPQIIRSDRFVEGFEFVNKNHLTVTDDVSIVESLGYPVKLVEGCYANLKITTPEDLALAEFLVKKTYG
jgi:2-C-methyl-D-erythritol 4-phosphate cytidylyltransferase